jgi:hypothetical protein
VFYLLILFTLVDGVSQFHIKYVEFMRFVDGEKSQELLEEESKFSDPVTSYDKERRIRRAEKAAAPRLSEDIIDVVAVVDARRQQLGKTMFEGLKEAALHEYKPSFRDRDFTLVYSPGEDKDPERVSVFVLGLGFYLDLESQGSFIKEGERGEISTPATLYDLNFYLRQTGGMNERGKVINKPVAPVED